MKERQKCDAITMISLAVGVSSELTTFVFAYCPTRHIISPHHWYSMYKHCFKLIVLYKYIFGILGLYGVYGF